MNSCEAGGFRLGRFHPTFELNEPLLSKWTSRQVLGLAPCQECPLALLCGGGCTRLAVGCCGDLETDVACPPMMKMESLQVLVDYYIPKILQASEGRL